MSQLQFGFGPYQTPRDFLNGIQALGDRIASLSSDNQSDITDIENQLTQLSSIYNSSVGLHPDSFDNNRQQNDPSSTDLSSSLSFDYSALALLKQNSIQGVTPQSNPNANLDDNTLYQVSVQGQGVNFIRGILLGSDIKKIPLSYSITGISIFTQGGLGSEWSMISPQIIFPTINMGSIAPVSSTPSASTQSFESIVSTPSISTTQSIISTFSGTNGIIIIIGIALLFLILSRRKTQQVVYV